MAAQIMAAGASVPSDRLRDGTEKETEEERSLGHAEV